MVTVDLNDMPDSQPVFPVDTKMDYYEIDRDTLTSGIHTIHLDRASDWALAVGEFGEKYSSARSVE